MKNYSNNEQRGQSFAEALQNLNESHLTIAEKVARLYDISAQLIKAATAACGRSAWEKGVAYYVEYLLDRFAEYDEYEYKDGRAAADLTRETLLNGAADWKAYSYGGSALIYDADIARVLCSPSELRRTHNGERQPNAREMWPDVQARALSQAWHRIDRAARTAIIK